MSSAAADSGSFSYDLNAPTNLTVSTGPSTATLTWVLTSTHATAVRIHRRTLLGATASPSDLLTSLPADARQYTDTGLTNGIYSYEVSSYDAVTNAEERSDWVNGVTQPAPLDGLTFQAQFASLGMAPTVQPDAQGEWLLWPSALGPQSYGLVTWTPTGSTQQAFTSEVGWISDPAILMDAGSEPHMAWVDGSGNLVHLWHTPVGWHTETVASSVIPFADLGGALVLPFLQAPDGSLHLYYATGAPEQYTEATLGPAGWTFTQDPHLALLSAFAMAPSGTLYGLQYGPSVGGAAQALLLWHRASDGTWTSEEVPGTGTLSPALFQADANGDFHFVFVMPADGGGPQGLVHCAWQSGLWSPLEYLTLESPQSLGGLPPMFLAFCPQDQRLFFSSNFPEGIVLFARAPDGTWSSAILVPASIYPTPFEQGLMASGKVFLVAWPSAGTAGAALYIEQ